ncbi:MAG TPA: twin-arginine translocase TatA/TatE family subunit [Candidatus Binatus sp.]|nr:twin-arginine translocase TatA/TatE family subunit [Candidatus Binatus sp.]
MDLFEIVLILAIALIVVGPERLPEVMRTVGKLLRELRLASNTVLHELTDVLEEPRPNTPAPPKSSPQAVQPPPAPQSPAASPTAAVPTASVPPENK